LCREIGVIIKESVENAEGARPSARRKARASSVPDSKSGEQLMRSTSRLSLAGLAPAALLWATPGLAFDCGKASTTVEHLICGSAEAKASDDAMAAAYSALSAQLDEAGRKDLLASQRWWLSYRDEVCMNGDASCVVSLTDTRRDQLTATPVRSGPGAPSFLPHLFFQEGTPTTYEVNLGYPQIVSPETAGERALNEALEMAAMGDSSTFLAELGPDDFVPPGQMDYELSYRIAYADANLVSVGFDIYSYGGGAHPNSWTRAVNFLTGEGRELVFADMFDETGAAALRKICGRQIREEKAERGVPADLIATDVTDQTLDGVVRVPLKWVFDEPGLLINFDAYSIGAYVEGSYVCAIDAATLAKIARPGAPLPR
jgi:uncharacterized protein